MTSVTINPQIIVGSVLVGLATIGLLIASVQNLRGAKGRQERRFLALNTVLLWALLVLLIGMMARLQPPYRYLILGLYFVVIPVFIYRISLRRQLIREWETSASRREEAAVQGDA